MELNKIYQGNSLDVLKTFPSESIDCIITSPPYYGLRDYGIEGQIGQEETPQEYISNLMDIMNECKRVLKKTGSLWINIGDGYDKNKSLLGIPERFVIAMYDRTWLRRNTIIWYKPNCMPSSVKDRFTVDFEYFYFFTKSKKYYFQTQYEPYGLTERWGGNNMKLKPDGKLAQNKNASVRGNRELQWHSNPQGRIKRTVWKIQTKPFKGAHFAIFPENLVETPIKACCPLEICNKCNKPRVRMEKILGYDKINDWMVSGGCDSNGEYKGKEIKDYKSAKAQMPSETKRRILKSMSKQTSFEYSKCDCNVGFHKGVVLDPFMGAGTVGVVAKKLGVNYVGIELNKDYIKMAENRINSIL
jgi:site-specific DNA-methyltransferase (adenine-specific)